MQGAPPLASPGLNPGGTGAGAHITRWRGGLPGWLPADLAVPESAGVACLLCRLPTLPPRCLVGWRALFVACLPCLWLSFLPPSPQPPSPPGKGEIFSFLMQGASPLASPGAGRDAALALLVENRFFRLQMDRWHPPGRRESGLKKARHPIGVPVWREL